MNGLARLSGRFRARRSERELGSGAERDERSLARHMRSLAVQLRVNGRARLSCPASLAAHTQALARAAGELLRESANAAATLQRLHQDARIMEACAAQARLDGGVRLPAVGRVPRILIVMREVVALGDTALSGERLKLALRAFDDHDRGADQRVAVRVEDGSADSLGLLLSRCRRRVRREQYQYRHQRHHSDGCSY